MSSKSALDWVKPMRGEAIARLRTNAVGLVGATILSNLLPIPSPWRAFDIVWKRRPAGAPFFYLCVAELVVFGVLMLNIAQALYALKYPRTPLPPTPSVATPRKATPLSPPARQWRLQGITPNASPQRQKPFSSYAPSPVSTPSRTLSYTIPPSASQADSSFLSSTSSAPGSPASPLAAYRGRHSASVGRAFDGSLLSRLAKEESDDDDS